MVLPKGWKERAAAKAAHKANRGAEREAIAEQGLKLKLARLLFSHESLKGWREAGDDYALTIPRATFGAWDPEKILPAFQEACEAIGLYNTRLLAGGGEFRGSDTFTFTIPATQFADNRGEMRAYFDALDTAQRAAAGFGK